MEQTIELREMPNKDYWELIGKANTTDEFKRFCGATGIPEQQEAYHASEGWESRYATCRAGRNIRDSPPGGGGGPSDSLSHSCDLLGGPWLRWRVGY